MSRIDDSDRQAQRIAEKLALEKRQAEDRAKKAQAGESQFSKLVKQGDAQKANQQQQGAAAQYLQHAHDDKTESGSIIGEAIALASDGETKDTQDKSRAKQTVRSFSDKLKSSKSGEGERASESRLGDTGRETMSTQGRTSDARTQDLRTESRRDDAKKGNDALSERGESALNKASLGGAAGARKGEAKADADGGGGKGSGGGSKDQGGANLGGGAGFRFNPALMAPVPVAKAKETTGSDRLRQIANEIAQKIVERVRVGTNATGAAEFQIDLRSNVLSGLSIKVSGGKGRIKLVFSGSDKEVLKALGEGSEGLKQALGGRGLNVEELRIEERA